MDSERKLILEDSRAELVAERAEVVTELERLDVNCCRELQSTTAGLPRPHSRRLGRWPCLSACNRLNCNAPNTRRTWQTWSCRKPNMVCRVPTDLLNEMDDTKRAIKRIESELDVLTGKASLLTHKKNVSSKTEIVGLGFS